MKDFGGAASDLPPSRTSQGRPGSDTVKAREADVAPLTRLPRLSRGVRSHYVCECEIGACMYRRQDLSLPLGG